MVHKTSHRGVHSGNTLRAFNSRYSRCYHNHSCIVSRIRPELMEKLIGDSKADDKKPELLNIAVDVPLSLNKQSRWCLPTALIRQIESNDIADSQLTVSLIERHKLKRQASCVSFHSNKGEVKRIQPRNGRYFGFSYPTVDGKSRRALRRERRDERLEMTKNNTSDKLMGKTVEIFTEQEQGKLGESEVRYEVYYPTPSKSSISHNPKYIKQDVDVAPGENEHVLHGKPKKQHQGKQRKRISLKDLDDCDLPSFHVEHDQPLTTIHDKEEYTGVEDIREEQTTTEYLITTLIEKAQQLQNFKGTAKSHRKKKHGKSLSDHKDDRSHIVYLTDPETPTSSDNNPEQSLSLIYPVLPNLSESARVMLPKEDVTMISLKEYFGKNYFEASCLPRKFVVDVTLNVQDVLKKQGIADKMAEKYIEAYLVCIHDGFYDDEFDVYKVLLNSRLCQGLLAVQINAEENQDLYRGTVMNLISRTMDFLESFVIDLQDKDHFPDFYKSVTTKALGRQLNSHLAPVKIYVPSVQRAFQKGSAVSEIIMPTLFDLLQEDPTFCDVCYDDISPLTIGSAAYTCLLKCKHQVCDSCWSQHIHARLHDGFVRFTCPEYDCQEEVKLGVLLSLVPLDTVEKLLQRHEEIFISGSQTKKWCPNESCGRVISLQPSSSTGKLQLQQDVVCPCGIHVCFQCLAPAHWPASCKQAEEYRAGLAAFPDQVDEVQNNSGAAQKASIKKMLMVEGKHCPGCKTFVYKNGECPQMACQCGQMFCWYCGKPGRSHPDCRNCVGTEQERKLTTTLTVRHLESDQILKSSKEEKLSGNRRQRTSLVERAVEHRRQHQNKNQYLRAVDILAKTVASATAKNMILSQHIIKACTEAFPSSSRKPSSESSAAEPSSSVHACRMEIVTAFLKNVVRSRQELHEMVEYSLVLLKDLPESLFRRRALRISEDLGAFCSFSQSVFDAWTATSLGHGHQQEAVKAVMRLAEIQKWIQSSLDAHVVTVRKLRSEPRSGQL